MRIAGGLSLSLRRSCLADQPFHPDIDLLACSEQEIENLVKLLDRSSTAYGMEISANKTKLVTNSDNGLQTDNAVKGEKLGTVKKFQYLGAIVSD